MKRIFTLAALFISMISFAAAPPRAGRIIINNGDYNNIVVRINGRAYNVDQQTLILNNLAGGRHHLEVFRTERRPYGYGRSKPVLIYSSAVYLDPSFIVDVNINRFGRVSVAKSVVVRNGNDRNGSNRYDNDRYGNGRDNRYDNDRYDDNNRNRSNDYDDKRYGHKGYNDKNYQDNGKANRPSGF